MIVILIGILVLYLLLILASRKEIVTIPEVKKGNKTLQKMSTYLYRKSQTLLKRFFSDQVTNDLKFLNPTVTLSQQAHFFYIKKISIVLIVILMGSLLVLCMEISSHYQSVIVDGEWISRNTYGEGEKEVSIIATVGDNEEQFQINILEQTLTQQQFQQQVKEMIEKIPSLILGKNESFDAIMDHLILIEQIEGYPISIAWESDRYDLIWHTGEIDQENIKKQNNASIPVILTAIFQYKQYELTHKFKVHINPIHWQQEETLRTALQNLIERENQENQTEDKIKLPLKIKETPIKWKEEKQSDSLKMLIFIVIASVGIFTGMNYELHKKVEQRQKQLKTDYPQLISKLVILLGSGLSLKNAWEKIIKDYEKEKVLTNISHYVYEEMKVTYYEMELGIPELTAYANFGKRCNQSKYLKLSSMLTQNLKRGSAGLFLMMKKEVEDMNEERKSNARQLGEEAGAKLLLPMMLMLFVVIIIIIIPSFLSFGI